MTLALLLAHPVLQVLSQQTQGVRIVQTVQLDLIKTKQDRLAVQSVRKVLIRTRLEEVPVNSVETAELTLHTTLDLVLLRTV